MSKESFYEILGVDRNATHEEIKKAYRNLSKSNHPDKLGDASMQAKINIAWDVLSDPDKRKRYDSTGNFEDINFNGKMMSLLNQVLVQIVDNADDVTTIDIVASCRSYIDQLVKQSRTGIKNMERRLDRMEKVHKRLKTKGNKAIILFVTTNIENAKKDIAAAKEETEFLLEVLVVLRDYTYEVDKMPGWFMDLGGGSFVIKGIE